jgi:hypothetical protein
LRPPAWKRIGSKPRGGPFVITTTIYTSLRQPDIDITDMDDVRKSLSKLKKGFKHRLGGKKPAGETVGSPASLLPPGPRVEDGRINTDVSQAHSTDPLPHPEPVTADEDRLDGPQSRKELYVEGVAGSGPSREINRASSPLSVTSIAPKQEPDSMWTLTPRLLHLITSLDNTGTPTVPDRVQPDLRPDENTEPSAIASETKSGWKSTAWATAKLLLRGVRDSADAFGPLKSVAGGLCFILENCEV